MTWIEIIGLICIAFCIIFVGVLFALWTVWVNDKLEYLERRLDNQDIVNDTFSRKLKKIKRRENNEQIRYIH